MAEGIATRKVRNEKMSPAYTDWLATNMWWPHTKKPTSAMPRLEKATNR